MKPPGALSTLMRSYWRETGGYLGVATAVSSVCAVLVLAAIFQKVSVLQSFTPVQPSVPLAQRFVKADDVQILLWQITGLKSHLAIALCLVVRALAQLSRRRVGVVIGHISLALAVYEVAAWAAWSAFIADSYMPGLDFQGMLGATPLGALLTGLVLLFMATHDLGLLIAAAIGYLRGSPGEAR